MILLSLWLAASPTFTEAHPGVEWATIQSPIRSDIGASTFFIVRLDPEKVDFEIYSAAGRGLRDNPTIDGWMSREHLLAATNAGMFELDHRTPVGFAASRDSGSLNSRWRGDYGIAFVAQPSKAGGPRARLVDRGCERLADEARQYRVVLQGIRMLDCTGKNRWSKQDKRWSTAAIAEDSKGRILFIHLRSPLRVHDFVAAVTSLGLGVSRMMYLEGGPEASVSVRSKAGVRTVVGSYETGFVEHDGNHEAWPLPNVIGVVPRK